MVQRAAVALLGDNIVHSHSFSPCKRQAARLGYLKTLVEAGAMVTHPYCSLCQGRSGGLVSGAQVVVGTHNRNFIGRMGSPAARTFLASPAVAAASALEGRIADPAPYL